MINDIRDRLLGGPQVAYDGLKLITSYSKTGKLSPGRVVYKYFRTLLKHWEVDLRNRGDHEKNTAKGKTDTRTQKQCKDHIRPLFKLCKKGDIPASILDALVAIVSNCENGYNDISSLDCLCL